MSGFPCWFTKWYRSGTSPSPRRCGWWAAARVRLTLKDDLRRLTDRLENQKTDRRALASMLIELATRLETGNTVTGLLEGFAGTKE